MAHVSPLLETEPVVLTPEAVPRGEGRKLLLVVAHADDPAFFVGGASLLWAKAGWYIICLRVTDDRWDSVGIDENDTVQRNAAEFREAAAALGFAEVHDLYWQTDVLGDASRVGLRERIIHSIRRFRPFGLVSFDPFSMFFEDNLDHKVVAEAVDEAFWTAKFDKHHPEHFREGLSPHACVERWYFGRMVVSVTHVFDTVTVLEQQLKAILCHRTMLANISHQMLLESAALGCPSPLVERAVSGDYRPLFETLLVEAAALRGAPFGLMAAETLRCHAIRIPMQERALPSVAKGPLGKNVT
jgi:LmbE family N-acetylglucosaminyl deacetylase